ncbi:MAG: hypothetical protein ACRDBO_16375 [Lachnospiraceae bacterium]
MCNPYLPQQPASSVPSARTVFPADSNPFLYAKLAQEHHQDQRLIRREAEKAMARQQATLWGQDKKHALREIQAEEKRSIFEKIYISDADIPEIRTEHSTINTSPRELSNLRFPIITTLRSMEDPTQVIYQLKCEVANQPQELHFASEKIASGTYLLKKLGSIGAEILAPSPRAKNYSQQLIRSLIASSTKTVMVPAINGWIFLSDGSYKYIEEGALTWSQLKKLAK